MRRVSLVLMSLLFGCASSPTPTLKDFTSDGCSLFPNGNARDPTLWCECCYQHDLAYWRGGTDAERLHADEQLRNCVTLKTGDATLAETMYLGVRSGGGPIFPTGYRWGYGWSYGRGYAPLSSSEQVQVDDRLAALQRRQRHFSCK